VSQTESEKTYGNACDKLCTYVARDAYRRFRVQLEYTPEILTERVSPGVSPVAYQLATNTQESSFVCCGSTRQERTNIWQDAPVPVTARPKAWVCCLRRGDHSFREVLLNVVRRCVWSRSLVNEETLPHWGLSSPQKKWQDAKVRLDSTLPLRRIPSRRNHKLHVSIFFFFFFSTIFFLAALHFF